MENHVKNIYDSYIDTFVSLRCYTTLTFIRVRTDKQKLENHVYKSEVPYFSLAKTKSVTEYVELSNCSII